MESLGEAKFGAWECRFGGVEVIEQLLDCSVGTGIGQGREPRLTLQMEADDAKAAQWEQQKSALREEIEQFQHQVNSLKEQINSTPKHLEWDQFPEDAKFERLAPSRKQYGNFFRSESL